MNLVPATDRFLGATAMRFAAATPLFIALVLVGCQGSDEGIENDVRDPVVFATHVKSRTVVYLLLNRFIRLKLALV